MKVLELSRKRSTLISIFGGYINTAILVIQGLLLIPLYLHFIGAHSYGLWLSTGGILGLLGVLNFGIGNIFTQRIANAFGKNDITNISLYFFNGVVVYFLVFIIFISIGIFLSYFFWFIYSGSELPSNLKECFQLALLATGLSILNECLRSFSQALLHPTLSILSVAISRILGTIISIMALYHGLGLWAIPLGMAVCELLIFIFGIFITIELLNKFQIKLLFNFLIVKEYFKQGGVMFVASVGSSLARESDPILITYLLSPEITAAYMISRRAADILFQLLAIFGGAIHSSFSNLIGQGNSEKISKIACKMLIIITILSYIGYITYIYLNAFFVDLWVGKNYQIAQCIIVIMGLGFMASSLRIIILQLLNGFGDFNFSSRVIFLEGLTKVLLGALALNHWGLIGASLAFLGTSIFSLVFLYCKLKQRIIVRLNSLIILKFMFLTLTLSFISAFVVKHIAVESWLELILVALIVLTIISLLLSAIDSKFFKRFFKDILNDLTSFG